MILTIWRHGTAQDGINDSLRELTAGGRDDLAFGCTQWYQACKRRNIPPLTTLLHSPLVRTTQTADIIARAFKPAVVSVEKALRSGGNLEGVDALIAKFSDDSSAQHMVLVSHQPLVSCLATHYLGEAGSVPSLSPGGSVTLSLDVAAACGTLLFWALPPAYEACL